MKKRLVVVTDLGTFKAYRLDENELNSHPRLELIETFEPVDAHGKLSEKLTDQAGQFPKGTGAPAMTSDMSNGERHNIALEHRRRLIKQLAEELDRVVRAEKADAFYFAASNEINKPILEELRPEIRGRLEKNVSSNLTKIDKINLLDHFRA